MKGKINLPHSRRFPPRLSPEELQKRSLNILEKTGCLNNLQSFQYHQSAKIAYTENKEKFHLLKSNPKIRNNKSWEITYILVFRFLEQFKMNNTESTIKIEANKILNDINLKEKLSFDILNLIKNFKKKTFKNRLIEFKKEKNINNNVNIENNDEIEYYSEEEMILDNIRHLNSFMD